MKEKISKRKTEDETICKTRLFHTKCLVNNKKTMSSEYSTTLSQWKVSETKSAFDDSNKAENMNIFFSLNFYSKDILNANISFCKQLNNRLQILRENIDLILQNSTIKGTKVLMEKLTNFWKSEMKEKISKRKTEDETICKTTLFHPKCLVNNKKTMSSEYSTTLSQWKVSETKSAFDDSNKAENMNNFFIEFLLQKYPT